MPRIRYELILFFYLAFKDILYISHIAQNIAERCQEYFQFFTAIEILSQHFC